MHARGSINGIAAKAQPPIRVALYSHDTMGIGHMRRNLLIAQTLAAAPVSATVLLIAGAREANTFALPANVDCLTLPSLCKSLDGKYQSRALNISLKELVNLRSQAIASALKAFAPDVLVVDKEPRGAGREMEPALAYLRRRGQTRCVLGLRDVLDDPATVNREWLAASNDQAIQDYYDAVWVYGDPCVYDLTREYRLSSRVCDKLTYTGYLDPCARLRLGQGNNRQESASEGPHGPFIMCMVGGGQDGAKVAVAFAEAKLPAGRSGVIVTGPYMPPDARQQITRRAADNDNMQVMDFVAEPCRMHQRAERVVAMGGYNTVSEVLAFEKPALIVPRVKPRQEQFIRACRLRELGLLDVLHPDEVSPATIERWFANELVPGHGSRHAVNMDGTKRLPGLLRSVMDGERRNQRKREVSHAAS